MALSNAVGRPSLVGQHFASPCCTWRKTRRRALLTRLAGAVASHKGIPLSLLETQLGIGEDLDALGLALGPALCRRLGCRLGGAGGTSGWGRGDGDVEPLDVELGYSA